MEDSGYSHSVGARMERLVNSGKAGWSSALRVAVCAVLLAWAGFAIAQEPANFTAIGGPIFGLPQTQFPSPAADSFQSYQGFQGRRAWSMGAGWQAGSLGGFGGGGLAGTQGRAGFGIQGGERRGAGASPNINQVLRPSFALPLKSSIGTFKFSFRDRLAPGGNASGASLGPGTPGAMFSTTNLGNGVFFSAGTNFGKGAMAGTPLGGFGRNGGTAGAKSPGPAVTLKLSF